MPRIVQFHRLGGPEVLEIEDVASSEPSSGEVMLRVQAIGLNRAESMFMHGYYLEPPPSCEVGIRSLWHRDRHRTRCRPEVALQERIDDTVVLTKSVWCAWH